MMMMLMAQRPGTTTWGRGITPDDRRIFFFVPRKIIVCINVRTARNVSFHALEDADGSGNQSCLDSSVVPVDAYHLGHFSAQVNRFHSQ